MECSRPGFPAHYQLRELTQTLVHRVGDAIQSSHPLSSPYSPVFSLSQHQGLFQRVCFSHGQSIGVSASASVLPMNIQDWFPLDWLDLLAVQETLKSLLQHHSLTLNSPNFFPYVHSQSTTSNLTEEGKHSGNFHRLTPAIVPPSAFIYSYVISAAIEDYGRALHKPV